MARFPQASSRRCRRRPNSRARRSAFSSSATPRPALGSGAPTRLLAGRGGVKLDFGTSSEADLGALYARLAAETPTRKIAYKAMKPDAFFVVSGQDGATKFYTRFDRKESANPPIRGFTFSYPASQAALLDRVAIAVAN
jgi:hypothetical protein